MLEDADVERMEELTNMIIDACGYEEKFRLSEIYNSLARAFAIILLDAGRSGRRSEITKNAACGMVAYWLDKIDALIEQKQH